MVINSQTPAWYNYGMWESLNVMEIFGYCIVFYGVLVQNEAIKLSKFLDDKIKLLKIDKYLGLNSSGNNTNNNTS